MMLSKHFSVAEFTTTQLRGVDNTPPPDVLKNLHDTADHMELVRAYLDHPVIVTSGYRSPAVNHQVGGSPTSAHMQGWAVDFIAPKFGSPLQVCRSLAKSGIRFDQIIQEGGWTHVSFKPSMRGSVLTAHFGKNGTTYTDGIA